MKLNYKHSCMGRVDPQLPVQESTLAQALTGLNIYRFVEYKVLKICMDCCLSNG